MRIRVKGLGLAAYVIANGGVFQSYSLEERLFDFESEREAEQWEIEYANSCCSRHDAEVMNLRKFMR